MWMPTYSMWFRMGHQRLSHARLQAVRLNNFSHRHQSPYLHAQHNHLTSRGSSHEQLLPLHTSVSTF